MYTFKNNFDFYANQFDEPIYKYALKDYTAKDGSKVGIKYFMNSKDNADGYMHLLPTKDKLHSETPSEIINKYIESNSSGYLSGKSIMCAYIWEEYNSSVVKALVEMKENNKALLQKLGYHTSNETIEALQLSDWDKRLYRMVAELIKETRSLATQEDILNIHNNPDFFETIWYESLCSKSIYAIQLSNGITTYSKESLEIFDSKELENIANDIRLFNKFNKIKPQCLNPVRQ